WFPRRRGWPARCRSAMRPSGRPQDNRAQEMRPDADRQQRKLQRQRRHCSWAVSVQQDEMKCRVLVNRLGIGNELTIHRLWQVGTAQMKQVPSIGLDQTLLELGQRETR